MLDRKEEVGPDDSSGIITDDGLGLARVHETVAHPGDLSDLRALVSANKDVSDVHKHLTANISDRLYFNFHPHIKEDQRRKRPINLTHFLSLFFLLLSSLLALSSLKNQVGCV